MTNPQLSLPRCWFWWRWWWYCFWWGPGTTCKGGRVGKETPIGGASWDERGIPSKHYGNQSHDTCMNLMGHESLLFGWISQGSSLKPFHPNQGTFEASQRRLRNCLSKRSSKLDTGLQRFKDAQSLSTLQSKTFISKYYSSLNKWTGNL